MSQPKRYYFIADLLPGQTRYPHHHFVLYDDYAALAAENERLKVDLKLRTEQFESLLKLQRPHRLEVERLKTEKEKDSK